MNNLPQKMIDTFLLNSVSMASDHVLNQASDTQKNEFIETMFKRGLLGQLKLREEYIGGSLEEDLEEDSYDFWN